MHCSKCHIKISVQQRKKQTGYLLESLPFTRVLYLEFPNFSHLKWFLISKEKKQTDEQSCSPKQKDKYEGGRTQGLFIHSSSNAGNRGKRTEFHEWNSDSYVTFSSNSLKTKLKWGHLMNFHIFQILSYSVFGSIKK